MSNLTLAENFSNSSFPSFSMSRSFSGLNVINRGSSDSFSISNNQLCTLTNIPVMTSNSIQETSPYHESVSDRPLPIPSSEISSVVITSAIRVSDDPNMPMPILQNVVSTACFDVKLDLKHIATRALNAEYNPKRFSAIIMRIREPRTTALIFNNGKIVCTGAKSVESSHLAARKFGRIIQKLGYPNTKFGSFKVQNLVSSCDVKFRIFLEALAITHSQFCTYEPELFPGLVYRMLMPKVVMLVFKSGKVVITRAQKEKDIEQGFRQLYPILKSFKR